MTATVRSLGYLVLGAETAADIEAWRTLGTKVMGLQLSEDTGATLRFRMDEYLYRLQIEEGAPKGVHTIGWEVKGKEELDEVVARLEKHGYEVTRHGFRSEEANKRNVFDLASFKDPDGLTIELFWGLANSLDRFASPVGFGFVASRELGLGHVFQLVSDTDKYNELYYDILGFKLSDIMGPATFYHCNPRHHSFAFVPTPNDERKRLQGVGHIMIETVDLDCVGRAIDAMYENGVKQKATLGRHTNDKMVSFYLETPSGTQIEYGTGGIMIDDDTWSPTTYYSNHYWGHDREGL